MRRDNDSGLQRGEFYGIVFCELPFASGTNLRKWHGELQILFRMRAALRRRHADWEYAHILPVR